jgi:hypothetical protein
MLKIYYRRPWHWPKNHETNTRRWYSELSGENDSQKAKAMKKAGNIYSGIGPLLNSWFPDDHRRTGKEETPSPLVFIKYIVIFVPAKYNSIHGTVPKI